MPGESTSPSASIVSAPLSLISPIAGDAAVLDREVGAFRLMTQPVDDRGTADDEIDHRYLRPLSAP